MAKPQPVIVAEPELVLKKGQRFFLENVDPPKDKDGVPVPSFSSTEVETVDRASRRAACSASVTIQTVVATSDSAISVLNA